MPISGVEAFDSTIHQTNVWLKLLMTRTGLSDRHAGYIALKVTLHALRDRLTPELAVHLGAQLPTLVRGFYYEDWHMAGTPTKERHVPQFVERVAASLRTDSGVDPEEMVRAVFQLLTEQLDRGEIKKVVGVLPRELRELWPQAVRS